MDDLIIFLSPGGKLKQARFELNITQEQLSNEKLTKRAISTIESGMRKLNYSTANIIVERVNELQKQLRQALDYDFTVDYLMEDIETQVTKEIEYIIEILSNSKNKQICDELIKRAERINKEYSVNPDLLIKVNNLAIDFYIGIYDFDEALYYTNWNNKLYLLNKDESNSALMKCCLSKIYIYLQDYNNVISIARELEWNDMINKRKEYLNVCFNAALAYFYMEDYKNSKRWLQKIDQNELHINNKLDILSLMSTITGKQGLYEESETYNLQIIKEAHQNSLYNLEANSYSNLAQIYYLKKDYKKALVLINKALEIKIEDHVMLMGISMNAFSIYIELNNFAGIKKYFEQVLTYATSLKRKNTLFELFKMYLKYCCQNNLKNEVEYISSLLEKEEYNNIDTGVLSLTADAFVYNIESIYKKGIKYLICI